MNTEQARALLHRYRLGLCSQEEITAIETWYESMAEAGNPGWSQAEKESFEKQLKEGIMAAIHEEKTAVVSLASRRRVSYLRRVVAAAAVLLAVGSGGYFLLFNKKTASVAETETPAPAIPNDVLPGIHKAVLTLANGRQLILDSINSGTLAIEKDASVEKLQDGQIAYRPMVADGAEISYNTITVPKGSNVIRLILTDDSKVWLDAGSSIVYPTAFNGAERKVEISGQAYFEIAKNPAMPFVVKNKNDDLEVKVTGTHFNVNAYENEPAIKITLLEGGVAVNKGKLSQHLKPGQQVLINDADNMELVKNADVEGVMAWKNGYFRLTSSDLPSILRQVERWYDVELQEGIKLNTGTITGTIPRTTSLLNVLKVLKETSGMGFKLNEREITLE